MDNLTKDERSLLERAAIAEGTHDELFGGAELDSCPNCSAPDGAYWDSSDLVTGGNTAALDNVTNAESIAYVRTCTPEEEAALANCARLNLQSGWWTGLHGDYEGEDDAVNFLDWALPGVLPDHFVTAYAVDLAGELRLGRGQCPHRLMDQHAYIDGWDQHAPLEAANG